MVASFSKLLKKSRVRTYVSTSTIHGLGCFSSISCEPATLIDVFPVLKVKKPNRLKHDVARYLFPIDHKRMVICLGHGSYLNDSEKTDGANCKIIYNLEHHMLMLISRKQITIGDELTICYDDLV